jgi:hypothetical protein
MEETLTRRKGKISWKGFTETTSQTGHNNDS